MQLKISLKLHAVRVGVVLLYSVFVNLMRNAAIIRVFRLRSFDSVCILFDSVDSSLSESVAVQNFKKEEAPEVFVW